MVNTEHRKQISCLVTNALLHLYCHITLDGRFFSVDKRNTLLIKWLKAQASKKKYVVVKKDIKNLILLARKPEGNVEERLWGLHQLNVVANNCKTDVDTFYQLLAGLEDRGYKSSLKRAASTLSRNVIYIDECDIEVGFDERSRQVRSIPFVVEIEQPEGLLALSEELSQNHQLELIKRENKLVHYLIHKTSV